MPLSFKTPPADAPPREMAREDRRLIFAKLEEVYRSEAEGYQPGWSDERVAREFDFPRAWVEKIRDENFGTLRDNGEMTKLVARLDQLDRDKKLIESRFETALADLKQFTEQARQVVLEAAALRKSFGM